MSAFAREKQTYFTKKMIKSREKIMKMIDRDRKNEIKKEARKNIMIFVNKIHIYATGVSKDLTLNIFLVLQRIINSYCEFANFLGDSHQKCKFKQN